MKVVLCNTLETTIGVVASVRDEVLAQGSDIIPAYCYLVAPWTKIGKVEKNPRTPASIGKEFNAIAIVDCPNPGALTNCYVVSLDLASPQEFDAWLGNPVLALSAPERNRLRQAGFDTTGTLRDVFNQIVEYT